MNEAASTGKTSHPRLGAVYLARLINQHSGGAVIAPWEVDQLDEEWQAVFREMAKEQKIKDTRQAFENRLIQRRMENPNYRKY